MDQKAGHLLVPEICMCLVVSGWHVYECVCVYVPINDFVCVCVCYCRSLISRMEPDSSLGATDQPMTVLILRGTANSDLSFPFLSGSLVH